MAGSHITYKYNLSTSYIYHMYAKHHALFKLH